MTKPDLACPMCGIELSIEQIFTHAQDHRAFMHLAAISIPLGARVLAYIGLFAPPRNRMTIARKVRLLEQLLPDLQRQSVNVNGREWHAPLGAWALAIDGMVAARDAGKLRVPLSSHGYLYAVLQGMADKIERGDEQQREAGRRTRTPSTDSADLRAVMDELGPDLAAPQQAITQRPQTVFTTAAQVLAANPHLKGQA